MTAFASQIHNTRARRCGGFTLIELMVSIALALLLVLGINAVFKMSADTVGTGMQMSEITRQFRTVRTQFDNDFTHMASRNSNPALIIQSYNQPAFKDHNDELEAMSVKASAQPPYDPSMAIDAAQAAILDVRDAEGNSVFTGTNRGSIPTRTYLPQILNNRNHRVDMLSFAVQNPNGAQRQSPNYGNGKMLTSGITQYEGYFKSTDTWVSYGHVLQPDSSVNAENMLSFDKTSATPGQTRFLGLGATQDPYTQNLYTSTGAATNTMANPNNFYASNWILGRMAMLLGDPSQLDNYANPYASRNLNTLNPQTYVVDPLVTASNGYSSTPTPPQQAALRPLSWGSALNVTTAAGGEVEIQTSQCDVAGLTLLSIHDKVLNAENPAVGVYLPRWYLPLVAWGTGIGESGANSPTNPQLPSTPPAPANTWVWPTNVATATPVGLQPWHAYRFMAQAWPDKLGTNAGSLNGSGTQVPAMHQQLAVQTPVFMRGCSQFTIEFAGDYLQQVNDLNDTAALTPPNPGFPASPSPQLVGAVKGIGEDGQIDFDVIVDNTGGIPSFIKRIRWYGMTRSLDDGQSVEDPTKVFPTTPGATPGAPPTQSEIVRPLYRYIQNYTQDPSISSRQVTPGVTTMGAITNMPFEKRVATGGLGGATYAGFPDSITRPQNIDSYTAAWGPLEMDLDQLPATPPVAGSADPSLIALWPMLQRTGPQAAFPSRSLLPWMIRITIRLDDPAGRLPDGQTMQFIFNVPRPH
jgi:prepilin-type N-terminal cleavage/methylation domain-containing protein